ncbi:hypothetical protein BXZ70DRAFT_948378 [Cristinia sonorae]|uniref:DUF6533 domain-containing protein n=1 Tax=Cristinia sonorae TaxID=1940300 RepID=A0A8K0UL36_9AGAR|nr:hypothetical protein BXZ70DRAFT_948378 [Cristinia sonorae]
MSLISPQYIDLYITAVRDAWLTRLTSFVVATLVTYDYFISFELEIELIWRKPWSIIKAVFLWHRYFGFLCVVYVSLISEDVTDKVSLVWFRWETWAVPLLLFSSEIVVILWIWIVYGKSKRVLAFMGILFSAEVITVLYILIRSIPNFQGSYRFHSQAHIIPGLTYCLITKANPQLKLLWIPILAFDSTLLVLYLYKGFRAYRDPSPKEHNGVLRMVYKHSLLNFLAIFASYLTCAVMWTAAEPGLSQIPVGFSLSLSITNCTRLLLNIRRAYYVGPHGDVSLMQNDHPENSTTPIVEWNSYVSVQEAEVNRIEFADSILTGRKTPDSPGSPATLRGSVEVKLDNHRISTQNTDRWQYELRTMKATA